MSLIEIISDQIKALEGEEALAKAQIVASRAALLKEMDSELDLTTLTLGLSVGHEGEMPEEIDLRIVGLTMTLAAANLEEMIEMPEPD